MISFARNPLPPPFEDWPRPFAFALSGGGGYGSVQVGMLRALAERGIRPDMIVGTSVGALHGALVAAHGDDAVEVMSELWPTMDRRSVFGGRRDLARNWWRHRTIASFDRLSALIEGTLGAETFEDLPVRFAAVATDVLTGEPELLSEGPLLPALLASAAVPGLFPAVTIRDRSYVDGGVAANVPIRQAIAFGAASVLSLDATPPSIATTAPTSFAGSLLHSASLMLRNQRSHAVDDLAHRYRIAVLASATPPDMGSFNFGRTAELLVASHRLASETLDLWSADQLSRSEDR